ncbi:hypothetical protein AJ80_06025 [Polytolypa hystricis UAMH7299]|uniref:Alpha/beta hydrolase fold-3 domain-containing protein n=1 Tax=Polytolypa hystricis (strain UAMH7299) TaxID=1447883 RepID=A0A2B7Y0A4_POLH7|nr:hypothetical protein AJ80_06025 [Polytolypa hystricis UAMH7299]
MGYQYDPIILEGLTKISGGADSPPPIPVGDVENRRVAFTPLFDAFGAQGPSYPDVEQKDHTVTTADGHALTLRLYTKTGATLSSSAAVLYMHGGGLIFGSLSMLDKRISSYVSATSVPYVSVDYRLAPEHPYPTPLEDCYTGLKWLHENAGKLGIDTSRIAVSGDSAGAGLAAALALLTRERKGLAISKQILIYPMLDDRTTIENPDLTPFLTWKYADNETAWKAYLGSKQGTSDVSETAAPARMTDATGLPELFIEVGELDIFCAENLEYARQHFAKGIKTELHVHPGIPHGGELFDLDSPLSKRIMADRVRVIAGL